MSLEISDNLQFLCKQITHRCQISRQSYSFEFAEILKCLNAVERCLIAKYFCQHNWNIGSLHVLAMLQELRIVTASEFILSQTDAEKIQLMLNDFLEAEFQLLTNLLVSSYYDSTNSIKLSSLLDECLQRLFSDLLQQPNLNNLDYLKCVIKVAPADLLTKITQKHINLTLNLHSCNVSEAFRNFSAWINEGVDDIQLTKDLYKKLLNINEQEALSYLFKLSTMEHFKEWKFYLILLQTFASSCLPESATFIKKFLKTRLRQIATLPSLNAMLQLLLTARAATATTLDIHKNLDAYAHWYKQHIGDMKFVLKTEEFQTLLRLLEESIAYELEVDYLEVHTAIAISPPLPCGKLVQTFKSKCKTHLAQLKNNLKPPQNNESIVIDDSE